MNVPTAVQAVEPAPGSPATGPRQATLDGLRGCAVLLILVHHFVGLHPLVANAPLGTFLSYVHAALGLTATGVDLFFVLSGFLIGGILLDHRESPQLLPTFYVRRALRILPLAWLNIALVLWFFSRHGAGDDAPAPWWIYGAFLTNFYLAQVGHWSFGPLVPHWSLAIEEQFYLAFPFLVRGLPRKLLPWLGPALILIAIAARLVIWRLHAANLFATHVLPFCRMDTLACGFTAACLVRSRWWPALHSHRARLWTALVPPAVGVAVLLKLHASEGDLALVTWGYTAIALFYAVILLLVYQPAESWLRTVFAARWLTLYGRYSYFIYLFQGLLAAHLVSLLFHGRWENPAPMTVWEVLAVPVVLLVPAAFSWWFIESPLLKIGHRLRYGATISPA